VTTSPQDIEDRFFVPRANTGALMHAAEEVVQVGGSLYGALFVAEKPPTELLQFLHEPAAERWKLTATEGFPSLLTFHYSSSEANPSASERAKAFMWKDAEHSMVGLLSCQPRREFDAIRGQLARFLFPDMYCAYLRTGEIRHGLNLATKRSPDVTVRVREYVCRSLIDDPESLKRVRTDRQWTDEDYKVVFDSLAENRSWVSSVRLELRGETGASGKIWRDGSFSCQTGFKIFLDTVLGSYRATIMRSRAFLQRRDRTTSPTKRVRPFRIEYPHGVFADKRQNHRLIRVLNRLPHSGLSVVHPNPYLHASLVDYDDGSSYDVWVTTETSILVVPKRKASSASMQRLCNHICDEFEEGELKEACG